MAPILSALIFALTASAQITTSVWMPSSYDDEEQIGYYASVVGSEGDRVTMALVYDNDTIKGIYSARDETQTVTVGGSTWFEYQLTTTDNFESMALTYSLGCSMPTASRAKPTCVYSQGGPLAFYEYCSDYSTYTDAYTTTWERTYSSDEFGPATVYTYTETVDDSDSVPSFCTDGTTLPEDYATSTMTLSRRDVATYQVIITAGQEKLSATTAAVPSNTLATITGTGPAPTGNATTGTAPLQVSGTGAAPIMTMAPALAGLGAAMAAFVL